MKLEWVPEAFGDYESAVTYYEERSDRAPIHFVDEVSAALEFVVERPQSQAMRRDGCRRIRLRKFPYYIPYVVRHDTVWVLAVAHNRRDPEFWIPRKSSVS